ncbi:hypothetical protein [Sphingomonas sp.]|uniref:hypothetical protein n=1 Tax=Sphingomonas sp. TaxID=28214 RepID=UPI002DD644FB|nr:hypothetical protein [Sphingomonas sp.]
MKNLPLALLLAAAAAPVVAGPRDVPAATPAGDPVDCISTVGMRSQVRSDQVIDFTVNGRTYRNTLPHGCPSLGFEQRFTYTLPSPRLCSIDIITVLQGSDLQRGAGCGLGKFQPVTLEKAR